MHVYIDEAGNFVVPSSTEAHLYSLVLAVTIPSERETQLFYEFLRLRDQWPNQAIEIKGSTLDESQAAGLIGLLSSYDVLVNYYAIDMATHGDAIVDDFKLRQAAALTENLTPEHHLPLVEQMKKDADLMRAMSNQLFLQCFLTIQLILTVVQESTLYYVQRQPKQLGEIAWFVDPKARTLTQMEEMWTKYILPIGENHFAKTPLGALAGADYSYFDARYSCAVDDVGPEMKRHLEWMKKVYGPRHRPKGTVLDANLILGGRREFPDSRQSLGIQVADMLATILRRAFNDRLGYAGWKNFGRLVVRHNPEESRFLELGARRGSEHTPLDGHAKNVWIALDAQAKSMLVERPNGGDDCRC